MEGKERGKRRQVLVKTDVRGGSHRSIGGGRLSLLTPCDTHTGMSEPIATDHRPSDIYNRCYTASERAYVATDGFFDAHSDQPGDR